MKESSLLVGMLQCPQCKIGALTVIAKTVVANETSLQCQHCRKFYPVVNGRPVLLRKDNTIFPPDKYRALSGAVVKSRHCSLNILIPTPSVNLAYKRILQRMQKILTGDKSAKILIIGGGCQRRWLDESLGAGDSIRIVYSDVDVRADVDVFCDGHDLPFLDQIFDAVITTAVLEHVLYPERVVSEISRVVKPNGLVYSELPFMQQVHEGAYDFTRYTLSGHRRLFNGFAELDAGMVAGPATALVWAIENFCLAFIRQSAVRSAAKAVIRITFAWLKYLDCFLVNRPEAMDGASCTYFLGRKIKGRILDADIIAAYVGAKHLRHS